MPDEIAIPVPVGARVLVVSELHLTREVTPASGQAAAELARAIDAWTGPGVLIFNGGTLDLLTPEQVPGRLVDPASGPFRPSEVAGHRRRLRRGTGPAGGLPARKPRRPGGVGPSGGGGGA